MKKALVSISALLILFSSMFAIASPAQADIWDEVVEAQKGSTGDGLTKLERDGKELGEKLVNFLRRIGIIIMVIMLVWMGYSLWFSRSAEGLFDMKKRLAGFFLGAVFAFATETIVGTVLSWLGYEVPAIMLPLFFR